MDLAISNKKDLEALIEAAKKIMNSEPKRKQVMNVDEMVAYVNERGYSISKSTIYKLTMEKAIPFRRFGERKMVFDIDEIDQWIENRLNVREEKRTERAVADAARRKENR